MKGVRKTSVTEIITMFLAVIAFTPLIIAYFLEFPSMIVSTHLSDMLMEFAEMIAILMVTALDIFLIINLTKAAFSFVMNFLGN